MNTLFKIIITALMLALPYTASSAETGYELDRIEWRHDKSTDTWFVDVNECKGCISNWMKITDATKIKVNRKSVPAEAASKFTAKSAYIVADPATRTALRIILN